ncbi:unnamed protein product, partial [Discosporangium mesarthrocarpum]
MHRWESASPRTCACLSFGVGSVVLLMLVVVVEVTHERWFVVTGAALALLFQILCWAMLLHGAPAPTFPERISAIGSAKYSTAEQCSPRGGSEPLVEEDNPINSDRSKGKQGFGLISLEEGDRKGHHDLPSPGRERREANGVASTGSETSAVAGSLSVGSAGERDKGQNAGKAAGGIFSDEADDDDFFQSPQPGILETPLEQVVRMLEFIVERHDPKPQTKRALDKAIELL